jgi:type VI secretion system protein ImpK
VARDGGTFRAYSKELLATADRAASEAGYDPEFVRLAVYAIVAFLDEGVLSSSQPIFSNWPRQPLQEEVFGDHRAGETFYDNVRALLRRQDSPHLADILEVHQLCLLLGFRGRHGSDDAELQALLTTLSDRVRRIRGPRSGVVPSWLPPVDEELPVYSDPVVRRLTITALALFVLAILLFIVFGVRLDARVESLRDLASLR